MVRILSALGLAVLVASVAAQTDTECGNGQKCPDDRPCCSQYGKCGIGAYCLGGCDPLWSNSLESCVPAPVCKSQNYKFDSLDGIEPNTKYLGDPEKANWVSSGDAVPFEGQLLLTMAPDTVGTVLASTTYMWYGEVSATLKTSRGAGVVTAFILFSDVKDEIDYEFVGADLQTAQSNFYYQGITNYNNGANISLTDTFNNFHTYTIKWTPEEITWSIDGQVGRVKKRSDTWNATANRYDYPQTPARVQISLWPAGLATNEPGTIEWAGGLVDWNSEDIRNNNYYYASLKEVSMNCYDAPKDAKKSGSKSYIYTDQAGTEDVVEITDKDTVLKSFRGSGTDMNAGAPSPSASSSSVSRSGSSTSSSSAPTVTNLDDVSVPGISGAGSRTEGTLNTGNNDSSNSDSGSGAGSGSGSSGSGSGGQGSSSSSSSSGGDNTGSTDSSSSSSDFSQGSTSSTGPTQGNGAGSGRPRERMLGGSIFAVLVAVAGTMML